MIDPLPDWAIKSYDPFDKDDIEKLLNHFAVSLDPIKEKDGIYWEYLWKGGGGILVPYESMSLDQARAAMALSVYLYHTGPHDVTLDDRLAVTYIQRHWPVRKLDKHKGVTC